MEIDRTKPWFKKKKITIPLGIFVFLLVARMVLVPVVHKQLNKFLATFSPTLHFHIADLDIHIIRGAYSFNGITGKVKGQKNDFVKISDVDVSVAWREIFKGEIVTDIVVDGLDFSYTKELKDAIAKMPKKEDEAKTAKDKLFPVNIERLDVKNSSVTLDDYPGLSEKQKFKIDQIDGRMTNITPKEDYPLSFFNLQARVPGESLAKATGTVNTLAKPLKWDVDGEMRGFNMTEANPLLKRKVPLTFTRGELDLYAEAKSEDGKIQGYVKPFLKNVDVMKSDESFKGPKHWIIEAITAVGNILVRAPDAKSVATRIPFSIDKGGANVDTGEAITKAIQHGFTQKLSPGVENKIEMK